MRTRNVCGFLREEIDRQATLSYHTEDGFEKGRGVMGLDIDGLVRDRKSG